MSENRMMDSPWSGRADVEKSEADELILLEQTDESKIKAWTED